MDRKDYLTKITAEDKYLIKLFQEEVDRINLLYLKAIHSNDITKANQLLKQIRKINNHLAQEYWKRAEVRLPQEYVKGSAYIDEVIEADSIAIQNLTNEVVQSYLDELWPIHIEAVNALVDNSKNYVKASLDWMERQALTMINELQQTQVREQLAKGIISGDSVGSSNERLVDYFTSQWISWFKDRGWKYWSMDRYVDMLTRTETAIANTQWTINRALELWITKFWIVEKPDCCEVCAEMNGDIVDIRDWVVELPPFHPNCRGYIVAIVDEEEWKNSLIPGNTQELTPEERMQKALHIIENSTMYLDYEQGAMVDMNWNIIRMASWDAGEVTVKRDDISEPYVYTHNHPNSCQFSFTDISVRASWDNEYWMRASSKIWTYSLYAERRIDKILFKKAYENIYYKEADKLAKADMVENFGVDKLGRVFTTWSGDDFVVMKDWNIFYQKDDPLKFDRLIDDHYWKYYREALEKAADYTPWVEFEFIPSDWIQDNSEQNKMYLEDVELLYKIPKKKNELVYIDKNNISVNKHF